MDFPSVRSHALLSVDSPRQLNSKKKEKYRQLLTEILSHAPDWGEEDVRIVQFPTHQARSQLQGEVSELLRGINQRSVKRTKRPVPTFVKSQRHSGSSLGNFRETQNSPLHSESPYKDLRLPLVTTSQKQVKERFEASEKLRLSATEKDLVKKNVRARIAAFRARTNAKSTAEFEGSRKRGLIPAPVIKILQDNRTLAAVKKKKKEIAQTEVKSLVSNRTDNLNSLSVTIGMTALEKQQYTKSKRQRMLDHFNDELINAHLKIQPKTKFSGKIDRFGDAAFEHFFRELTWLAGEGKDEYYVRNNLYTLE